MDLFGCVGENSGGVARYGYALNRRRKNPRPQFKGIRPEIKVIFSSGYDEAEYVGGSGAKVWLAFSKNLIPPPNSHRRGSRSNGESNRQ